MNLRKSNSWRAKNKREHLLNEKRNKQLLEKGYTEVDVWNMYDWFIRTASPMLKELATNHIGHPSSLEYDYLTEHQEEINISYENWVCWPEDENSEGYQIRKKVCEICDKQWTDILNRMSFLLDEMDEEKCSMENPYQDEWWQYHLKFDEKYPDKNVFKTEEEIAEEKKKGAYRLITPSEDPDFGKEYDAISKKMVEAEREISSYKDSCKNEFMDLFKKYFWSLWD